MKKQTLLILGILLFATVAFAAESIIYGMLPTQDYRSMEVAVGIVTAANGSVSDSYLSDSSQKKLDFQRGYKLHNVRVIPGTPGPTENSDFTLVEAANGVDVLGGAGVNAIDNATSSHFQPLIGSTPVSMPVYGPLLLKISGNSVDSAKFKIVFDFEPMD